MLHLLQLLLNGKSFLFYQNILAYDIYWFGEICKIKSYISLSISWLKYQETSNRIRKDYVFFRVNISLYLLSSTNFCSNLCFVLPLAFPFGWTVAMMRLDITLQYHVEKQPKAINSFWDFYTTKDCSALLTKTYDLLSC